LRKKQKNLRMGLEKINEFESTMVKSQIEFIKKRKSKRSGSFLTDKQFQEVKMKLKTLRAVKERISEKNK
jgi:hypothetical protein